LSPGIDAANPTDTHHAVDVGRHFVSVNGAPLALFLFLRVRVLQAAEARLFCGQHVWH